MLKVWMQKMAEFEISSYIEEMEKESMKKEEEKKGNEERKCIEIVESNEKKELLFSNSLGDGSQLALLWFSPKKNIFILVFTPFLKN